MKDILDTISTIAQTIANLLGLGGKAQSQKDVAAESRALREQAERQFELELEQKWGVKIPPRNPPDQN